MKITENTIDNILIRLDQEEEYDVQLAEQFATKYEDYLIYLEKEIFAILTSHESDLLLFIHHVILEALLTEQSDAKSFELHEFFDAEDSLWEHYEDNIKVAFRKRITKVFELIDEEDALAFVEDLLMEPEEDDEQKISTSGKDVLWNVSAGFIQLVCAN